MAQNDYNTNFTFPSEPVKPSLIEKVHRIVRIEYGDRINEARNFYYFAPIEDRVISSFIDEQSTSWLLKIISEVLSDE